MGSSAGRLARLSPEAQVKRFLKPTPYSRCVHFPSARDYGDDPRGGGTVGHARPPFYSTIVRMQEGHFYPRKAMTAKERLWCARALMRF